MPGSYLIRKRIFMILKESFPNKLRLVEIANLAKTNPMKAWDNLKILCERNLVKKMHRGYYIYFER